jgi:thiopeptide-type bacteriocin biosynthesis protein
VLRDYEIAYLGRSGALLERQIPVTDLLLSVSGQGVVLRSARLGRRVIPRLSSAHNFSWASLGTYHFLCALQWQGLAGRLAWDWGALGSAPFLPRVTTGRLVLSKAQWRLRKEELKVLGKHRGAGRFGAVQVWRAERGLPRLIALADGDNTLPVDLDNVLSVDSFVHLVKDRDTAIVVEVFPGQGELCARGPEGRFVHELVVPFVRDPEPREPERAHPRGQVPRSESAVNSSGFQRGFPPGSEWSYLKLYCGSATADHLLRDVIAPFIREVQSSEAADSWFFVRYADPDPHLRLRFHGAPQELHQHVLPALQATVAPLLDDGRVWRIQIDTYEREVERYGGPEGIVLAERIFHADADAVLEIVEMLDPGDEGADERWRLTVRGIDTLLEDLGFDLETKRVLLERVREQFAKEFRAGRDLKRQLGQKFEKERKALEALLDRASDTESPLSLGLEALARRSERLAPLVAELRACEQAGRLSRTLVELAQSYIHMHANRLLRAAHRAQELVLYDFLARLYESRAARLRTG